MAAGYISNQQQMQLPLQQMQPPTQQMQPLMQYMQPQVQYMQSYMQHHMQQVQPYIRPPIQQMQSHMQQSQPTQQLVQAMQPHGQLMHQQMPQSATTSMPGDPIGMDICDKQASQLAYPASGYVMGCGPQGPFGHQNTQQPQPGIQVAYQPGYGALPGMFTLQAPSVQVQCHSCRWPIAHPPEFHGVLSCPQCNTQVSV